MDDLTKRLREACCDPEAVCHDCALHREAADRIETLAAKCEALEEALAAKSRPLDPRMKAAIQEGYPTKRGGRRRVAIGAQIADGKQARPAPPSPARRGRRERGHLNMRGTSGPCSSGG